MALSAVKLFHIIDTRGNSTYFGSMSGDSTLNLIEQKRREIELQIGKQVEEEERQKAAEKSRKAEERQERIDKMKANIL